MCRCVNNWFQKLEQEKDPDIEQRDNDKNTEKEKTPVKIPDKQRKQPTWLN